MKKLMLVLVIAVALAAAVVFLMYEKTDGKSASIERFYAFDSEATGLRLEEAGQVLKFERQAGVWRMVEPFADQLDPQMAMSLDGLFKRGVYSDLRRPVDQEALASYTKDARRVVLTSPSGERSFFLGESMRQEGAEERSWAYVQGDGQLYRIFSFNLDLATLLAAPAAQWRDRAWGKIDERSIAKIRIETGTDRMLLVKNSNPKSPGRDDWGLAELTCDSCDKMGDLEQFEVDTQTMATLLDLLAPFYVDDVADDIKWDDVKGQIVGARLSVLDAQDTELYTVTFGPEVELGDQWNEAILGKGARYIKLELGANAQDAADHRVGIVSIRRLTGVLPTVYDLHTKRLWNIASTLSGVVIRQADGVRRFVPGSDGYWVEEKRLLDGDGGVEVGTQTIDNGKFELFIKTLISLRAERYILDPNVKNSLVQGDSDEMAWPVHIEVLLDADRHQAHVLRLSAPMQANAYNYRIAQVDDGLYFYLSEPIVKRLLSL